MSTKLSQGSRGSISQADYQATQQQNKHHRSHTVASTIQGISPDEEQLHSVHMQPQQVYMGGPFGGPVSQSRENSFSHEQHMNQVHGSYRIYGTQYDPVETHVQLVRSPHRVQNVSDGRLYSMGPMGPQSQHGNTWVMSGANWMSARQASPTATQRVQSRSYSRRESSPAPQYVVYDDNDRRIQGTSIKMMNMTGHVSQSMMHRTQNIHSSDAELAATAPKQRAAAAATSLKAATIMLETKQAEDGGLEHMSKPTQLKISQKVVDHTYRLFGSQLIFAKDVPTHQITDSESLRRLDQKNQRWLRFEIELSTVSMEEPDAGADEKGTGSIGNEEILNLALYDQADPNNLFLASVDKAKFQRLQARQNLKIEQFSFFGCHFQSLLNHCIDENANGFLCTLKDYERQTSREADSPLLSGLQMQIFEGSCFRNLLHLELFFRKANDAEARLWISRKQVIAWGIINELSVEIEKLESVAAGDCEEIQSLKGLLERTKIEHVSVLELTTDTSKREALTSKVAAESELEQTKLNYEQKISKIELTFESKITAVESELESTRESLAAEGQRLQNLNTQHLLELQKSETLTRRLGEVSAEAQAASQARDELASRFELKDRESLERNLTSQKLSEQVEQSQTSLSAVTGQRDQLADEKLELMQLVEQLRAQVAQLSADKEGLQDDLDDKAKKIDKQKKKKDKLKDEKKDKKGEIKELEQELEKANERTQAVTDERDEAIEQVRNAKTEIEAQISVIGELKSKLTESMDTLKKNSETIEFLNKSLTEAQKYSFRALLSSKQNAATGSVAAVATAIQRQTSATQRTATAQKSFKSQKSEQILNQSVMSKSRSRSPYCEVRQASNSPLRLMQKQQHNSNMLINANSFSNVKSQDSGNGMKLMDTTQHVRANMRESIQDSGVYAFANGCECKDYQAELKLTNKYAARFGMDESDQHHAGGHLSQNASNNYASYQSRHSGTNYMMQQPQRSTMSPRSTTMAVNYQAPQVSTTTHLQQQHEKITIQNQQVSGRQVSEQQQSHSSLGGVIMRGVPSQELRHADDATVDERKRDEKESRYSRHISSKASFGAQPSSYLIQQHQNVLQHRARYDLGGARENLQQHASIFGKPVGRNGTEFESREEYVTMSRQDGEAIQTYQHSVQEQNESQVSGAQDSQQQVPQDGGDDM